ncbi:hypothetical protein CAEBREN_10690 [Caenorhabditis brenneri]|uniref:Uncharacterized protein n=1 Tax=Caenorhabditis brenneri TaxID=135651 RepID=G0MGK9_CAEBE|nr:hypothetical protein CAEBREN_10690 [Caenorhabditis brenneri]
MQKWQRPEKKENTLQMDGRVELDKTRFMCIRLVIEGSAGRWNQLAEASTVE